MALHTYLIFGPRMRRATMVFAGVVCAIQPTLAAAPGSVTLIPSQVATPPRSIQLPIAMYHYVEVVQNPRDTLRQRLSVSPAVLEAQLQELRDAGATTLFVRDIPAVLSGKTALQPKSVVLTFDDGYADFYQNVLPLLRKYQLRASLYVITDRIGKNDYLTADQLKEIAASGWVEVGSHTVDHLDLSTLSPTKAQFQIQQSKQDLEYLLGVPVETFAYPSGKYTSATITLVRNAGYTAALSTHGGTTQTPADLFTLRRLRPGTTTGKNFRHLLGLD